MPSLRSYKLVFLLISGLLLSHTSGFCEPDVEDYSIGREDVLEVSVWQSPDLTKTLTVGSKGAIEYPFLGLVKVEGLKCSQVQSVIAKRLSEGYVKDPRVSVTVKEYNSKKILVFGEVVQPGLYKIKGSMPVLELLFLVGGVKSEAKRLTVIRTDAVPGSTMKPLATPPQVYSSESTGGAIEVNLVALLSDGDLSQNIMIQPGDTIYVAEGTGLRYYVLGQVQKPGPYEWSRDVTVLEAIKLADGATPRAALNRILHRKTSPGGGFKETKLNVGDVMKGKKKDDVLVKPGDVIVVPESWI